MVFEKLFCKKYSSKVRRKKFNKKADMTVSFSWIFMIIVGAFFFFFSWKVIGNYQENKEIEYKLELKQALRTVFNNFGRTAGVEENTMAPLGNIFRDSRVEIICHDGIPILSINDNLDANNDYLNNYPTFMSYIEQGKVDNTYLAVESFRMPFKISNMLAIVSKKNLILIDKSSVFGEKLYDKFRKSSYSELSYEYVDFSSYDIDVFKSRYLEDKNYNSVVFVTDYDKSYFNSLDISQLNILSTIVGIEELAQDYGKIYFKDQESKVYNYSYYDYGADLGLQTMAVFSTPNTFDCSYSILMSSFTSTYNFYLNKSGYYKNFRDNICVSGFGLEEQEQIYEDVVIKLDKIKKEVKNHKFINSQNLSNYITNLDDKNFDLEANGCPYIY